MRNDESTQDCLTDDDLYAYVAKGGEGNRQIPVEAHLANCSHCRDAVADLLRMLHPEPEPAMCEILEPDQAELDEMIALVQQTEKRERAHAGRGHRRQRWLLAAAAALAIFAIGLWSFQSIRERYKARPSTLRQKPYCRKTTRGKAQATCASPFLSVRRPPIATSPITTRCAALRICCTRRLGSVMAW